MALDDDMTTLPVEPDSGATDGADLGADGGADGPADPTTESEDDPRFA